MAVTLSWRRTIRPLIASAILLVTLIVLLPGVVLRGESPSEGDLTRFHRPVKSMMTRLWSENRGDTPEWTPYLSSGQPFRANPHFGAAHPSVVLFRVLPFDAAFLIWVLLPLPLGAAGMFLLLRELGRRRGTAYMMGGAWGLGGFALSTVALPPIAWTAMLAPGAAALVLRTAVSPSLATAVAAAAGLALCVSGGSPVAIVATGVLILGAIFDRRFEHLPQPATVNFGRSALLRLLVVGVLAGALAAPVLLPGAALSERSIRDEEMAPGKADEWSLPPIRLLEPWIPTIAGSAHNERWSWLATTYDGRSGDPLIASVYPGILISVLALAAVGGRRRSSLPWFVVGVFGALAALGPATPLWSAVLIRLPLIGGIRYPEKWVILPAIAAIVLAASALDDARSGDLRARRLVSSGLLATSLIGFCLAVAVALRAPVAGLLVSLDDTAGANRFVCSAAMSAAAALIAFLAWELALRVGRRWGAVLIGAALAADLAVAGRSIVESRPAAELDEIPVSLAPLVTPGGGLRLFDLASWQPGCRPSHPALQPRPIQWGIPLVLDHTYDLTQLKDTAHAVTAVAGLGATRPDLLPEVLARRGVDAVLTCPPDTSAPRIPVLIPVPDPSPLASCAETVVTIGGDGDWAGTVSSLPPQTLRRTAIIDGGQPEGPILSSPCRIESLDVAPDQWRVQITGEGPDRSYVLLTQTWDRFWIVRIDGQSRPLERCEINLSGLWIDAGPHLIELEYRDPTIAIGFLSGLLGAALCTGLLLVEYHRRTRRGREENRSDSKSC